jgi:peptidoglycan/LPS O-acetylase OafA/YrhL
MENAPPSSTRDGHRANNFDAVRLVAALSVVFSHSFLIAEGSEANEPFVWITGNQCVLGLVGVFVFFIISGYLVTESYCRLPAPGRFAARRALRIYPGLLANVLVCAFLIGPMISALPVSAYFASPELRQFLVETLTLNPGPLHLPGVLFADNSVGLLVNGSLWTLRYEIMMYLMILVLAAVGLLRLSSAIVLVGVGVAAVCFEKALTPFGDFGEWAWLVGFFASGMVLHFVRERLAFDWRYALLAVAALVLFVWLGRFIMLFPLAGAYLVIWFARRHDRWLDYSKYCGDLSYGLYIYGWPAEQLVMYLSGGKAAWWQVFAESLALALPAAWLSWHGIEKWVMRWGRRLPARRLAAATGD